jgi:hypothetical protein
MLHAQNLDKKSCTDPNRSNVHIPHHLNITEYSDGCVNWVKYFSTHQYAMLFSALPSMPCPVSKIEISKLTEVDKISGKEVYYNTLSPRNCIRSTWYGWVVLNPLIVKYGAPNISKWVSSYNNLSILSITACEDLLRQDQSLSVVLRELLDLEPVLRASLQIE